MKKVGSTVLQSLKKVKPFFQEWPTAGGLRQCGQLPPVRRWDSQNQEEGGDPGGDEEGDGRRHGRHCVPQCCRQKQEPGLRLRGVR